MQRGSGGMQDGGQGTGSLHTWEEGKKGFPKKPAAQSASPASHPFSLSLSLLARLFPLHPPLCPLQAESVMTVLRRMAGCGGA